MRDQCDAAASRFAAPRADVTTPRYVAPALARRGTRLLSRANLEPEPPGNRMPGHGAVVRN